MPHAKVVARPSRSPVGRDVLIAPVAVLWTGPPGGPSLPTQGRRAAPCRASPRGTLFNRRPPRLRCLCSQLTKRTTDARSQDLAGHREHRGHRGEGRTTDYRKSHGSAGASPYRVLRTVTVRGSCRAPSISRSSLPPCLPCLPNRKAAGRSFPSVKSVPFSLRFQGCGIVKNRQSVPKRCEHVANRLRFYNSKKHQ